MIQLKSFNVENITFSINEVTETTFKVPVKLLRGFDQIDDKNYVVNLALDIKKTTEHDFPFDFHCETKSVFYSNDEDEEKIHEYLSQEGTAIAYSFVRMVASNITSAAMVQSILIPPIDVTQNFNNIFKDIDED